MAAPRKSATTTVDHNTLTDQVNIKLCSMGVVTSVNWLQGYAVIANGTLKIYNNEFTSESRPEETILDIALDKNIRASAWKRKEYAEVSNNEENFYCFYLQQNSMLGPMRIMKIGIRDSDLVERFIRCIEANTQNQTA